eukprot:scaffold28670_cov66-Phaeocystis_antarctica.AAC.6
MLGLLVPFAGRSGVPVRSWGRFGAKRHSQKLLKRAVLASPLRPRRYYTTTTLSVFNINTSKGRPQAPWIPGEGGSAGFF